MQKKNIMIKLPDGQQKNVPQGISLLSEGKNLFPSSLWKKALAARVNGCLQDLATPLWEDARVELITFDQAEGKQVFWHSSAHVLAEALEALYPGVQLGIGPPIAGGFYYDIDFLSYDFDASHFDRLEKKMVELAKKASFFTRMEVSKEAALAHYQRHNNPYKRELIEGLEDGKITFYQQGNLIDLCKGIHLPHTGYIKAIKLLNIAGAYWRGDEKRKQLTRIYGVSFPQRKALEEHLACLEEAKKRDHRKLGKELKLFTFSNQVGVGLPIWLPKGAFIREQLISFLRKKQEKAGYVSVVTPHIGGKKLYETSGHFQKYGKDTFQPIQTPHEEEVFLLKPMNCPHHCIIYQDEPRSYRQLPLRLAEFGTVYRYEQSGELHGLTRVRGFTQDDAHIFCRSDQVKEEFLQVVDLVLDVFQAFDFTEYQAQISLRDPKQPEKYIGSPEQWDKAEQAIQEAVKEKGFSVEAVQGEAAFYGPKLDFMVQDALGRKWQLGTVQIDYQLPERFDLSYIGEDNAKHRPVMIHRAPFGSLERFMSILIEHTAGKFPLWLLPEQVRILPLGASHLAYAQEIMEKLQKSGIRVTLDARDEKVGKKIREAECEKIPFMLVIGDKEMDRAEVSVRRQSKGMQGTFTLAAFIQVFQEAKEKGE